MGAVPRLLRCPFCGGVMSINEIGDKGWRWFYIASGHKKETRCKCGVFMESEKFLDDETEFEKTKIKMALIDKWNRRTEKP